MSSAGVARSLRSGKSKMLLMPEGVWQNDLGAAGRLAGEYVKYVVIRVREQLLSGDKKEEERSPA